MNIVLVCLLAVWFINALIIVSVVITFVLLNRNIKRKHEFEQLKFNFEFEPKESDFKIIDDLIQTNLAEYRILKLENVDKLYITEKIQHNIFEYVLRKVLYQISPIYMQRLSYIYNKDRLDEIISQKINMYILDYTVEVNGSYKK